MNRERVLNKHWIFFLEYCKRHNWEIEATETNFWKYYYELEYDEGDE